MRPPTSEALKFFAWAYKNGDKMAEDLDYIPMPDNVVTLIEKTVEERDQGRRRQAGLLRHMRVGKGAGIGALSFVHRRCTSGLCCG